MKKIISLILTGALVFGMAGCGQSAGVSGGAEGENTEGAKGAYVESELSFPEGFSGKGKFIQESDGSVSLADYGNGTISNTADSQFDWKTEEIAGVKTAIESGCELTSFTEAKEYGVFASYVNWINATDEKMFPEKYFYRDADGNETEFELALEDYHCSLTGAVFESDGKVLVLTNSDALYRIDPVAQTAETVSLADSSFLYTLMKAGEETVVLDGTHAFFLKAGSTEADSSDTVLNDHITESSSSVTPVITADMEGKVYVASGDGIFTHTRGGNLMEQIVDGNMTTLGDPSETPSGMAVLSDGAILVLYQSGKVCSYIFDPDVPSVPENILTVYSLYDSKTARQAGSVFREKHSDFSVKFEVGITGDDSVTVTDAIQSLNTRLLAGEGPDVILMNGMSIDSYVEKDMLSDLSELIGTMEQENDFYENILKAYQTDSGLYAVPIRFTLPLVEGDMEQIAGITDLKSLTEKAEELAALDTTEESVIGAYDPEELMERLYPLYADSWYKEDGSADTEAVKEFLEYAKRLYTADQENVGAEEREVNRNDTMASNDPDTGIIYVKQNSSGNTQLYNQLAGRQEVVAGIFDGISDIKNLLSCMETMGNKAYKNYTEDGKTFFVPSGIAAISASSGRLEEAEEFLGIMLGTEVQSKDLDDGFPVNKDAFASYSANPDPDMYECVGLDDRDGNEIQVDLHWPTDSELEELEQMIEAVDTPAGTDNTLKDEIVAVGVDALMEEKGIDESASEIAQKISIRAQE